MVINTFILDLYNKVYIIFLVNECKKRWKNIKDTYNRKKRNMKMGTGSSAKNKPSKWPLSDVLSFLDAPSYERA